MTVVFLILIIMVLIGIASMSKVKTAVNGNLISALAMLIAVVFIMYSSNILTNPLAWIAIIVGALLGYVMAVKVKMIQMPQTVAMLNAFGGLASFIVAVVSINDEIFTKITGLIAIFIGLVTFFGSMIAAGKLSKKLSQRPVVIKNHSLIININLIILLVLLILSLTKAISLTNSLMWISIFSIIFAILFSIRVGGADMPIVISLLNSTSGVAGSISGMVIFNPLLISVGAIVGASGLILTQIMCKAMNRNLKDILLGKTSLKPKAKSSENIDNKKPEEKQVIKDDFKKDSSDEINPIKEAKNVIIVPGYGMALSQAQSKVKELMNKLEENGAKVEFAIHPVAGRMPGHMNVLLAEVDIDYDKFIELDEANKKFKDTDLVIVIGANDVINPAANTAKDTPIYGMPILKVEEAKNIIICNFDKKPGYAGVENSLYENKDTRLLLGDAKDSIDTLIKEMN
ncbi:MAG: NAD(P)(+) transhydrogenase (Re/Si-specific) subunit beta [Tissierellia bacterium]|nr:NAD(P)(+) transhydrogenase (Re/Si-specific) subunit beta [Tissierellia bacterium]